MTSANKYGNYNEKCTFLPYNFSVITRFFWAPSECPIHDEILKLDDAQFDYRLDGSGSMNGHAARENHRGNCTD